MTATVALWYDAYHTPMQTLATVLDDAVVVNVDLGGLCEPMPDAPPRWASSSIDARDEWCERFVLPAIQAHAVYQGGYVLSAALARPIQAEICARRAHEVGAARVVHGFAGNDQVRFEMAMATLCPELTTTSVARLLGSENGCGSDDYTVSDNLWGRSTEAGELADPGARPPTRLYRRCREPDEGASAPMTVCIGFERGRPTSIDGRRYPLRACIEHLDAVAGRYQVGATDCVEDGFVGLKSRALYEAPGAHTLIAAHRDLQRFVSSRRQSSVAHALEQAWTDLVYDGFWFDPARASIEAYLADVNAWVTGSVDVVLQPGGVSVIARRSAYALYDDKTAIYRIGRDADVDSPMDAMAAPMRAAMSRGRQPVRIRNEVSL